MSDSKVYGVYIMKVGELYKVGLSSNVTQRAKSLGGEVLNYTLVGDYKEAWFYERLIHSHMKKYHVVGEYFKCEYSDVLDIYEECLNKLSSLPFNCIQYVDTKPLNPPECDGSLESIVKRFKYLVTA